MNFLGVAYSPFSSHQSFWVLNFIEARSKDGWVTDLDRLKEVRETALVQSTKYQQAMGRYHGRHVHDRSFEVGDLALHKIQTTKNSIIYHQFGKVLLLSQNYFVMAHIDSSKKMVLLSQILRTLNNCVDSMCKVFFTIKYSLNNLPKMLGAINHSTSIYHIETLWKSPRGINKWNLKLSTLSATLNLRLALKQK